MYVGGWARGREEGGTCVTSEVRGGVCERGGKGLSWLFWPPCLCLPANHPHCLTHPRAARLSSPSCAQHTCANPQELLGRETLVATLARVLREDGRRSLELATSLTGAFWALSVLAPLHRALLEQQVRVGRPAPPSPAIPSRHLVQQYAVHHVSQYWWQLPQLWPRASFPCVACLPPLPSGAPSPLHPSHRLPRHPQTHPTTHTGGHHSAGAGGVGAAAHSSTHSRGRAGGSPRRHCSARGSSSQRRRGASE